MTGARLGHLKANEKRARDEYKNREKAAGGRKRRGGITAYKKILQWPRPALSRTAEDNAPATRESLNSLYPFFPGEAFVVDFSVRTAGIFRMPPCIETVAVGDVSMVRRFFMRPRPIMLGRLMMMMRRLSVMFCSRVVMFDCLFSFRH